MTSSLPRYKQGLGTLTLPHNTVKKWHLVRSRLCVYLGSDCFAIINSSSIKTYKILVTFF